MFGDTWSYRWNTQMFAAPGYVMLMINRARLDGLRPEVHRRDLRRLGRQGVRRPDEGPRAVLAKYPFTDETRVAAAGGRTAAT